MGDVGGDLIPLGIASLAAYIREKGFGVGVLDCPALRIDPDEVFEIIKKKNPSIIGFSTTTYTLPRVIEIAKKIRDHLDYLLRKFAGCAPGASTRIQDPKSKWRFYGSFRSLGSSAASPGPSSPAHRQPSTES